MGANKVAGATAAGGEANESKKRALDDSNDESTKKASKLSSVRCRHILIKHRESRRPSSWKEENIARTKDEAIAIAEEFRSQIAGGGIRCAHSTAFESLSSPAIPIC